MKRTLLVMLCLFTILAGAGNVLALPFFSEATKRAVFLSPLEAWFPTWGLESYVSALEQAGYQVDVMLNENVSIAFLQKGLADYDLIIIRTDSFYYEGANYYCSGEPINSTTRATFAGEVSSHELHLGPCLGFSPSFLEHNYFAGSLRPGLVFAIGSATAELSSIFLAAGSSVFLGYYEDYSLGWGTTDALSIKLLSYLSQGETVTDGLNELRAYLHSGHGDTADWPSIYWSGDGSYII